MSPDHTYPTEQLLHAHQRAKVFVFIGTPLLSGFGLLTLNHREWPLFLLIATSVTMILVSYVALRRGFTGPYTVWPAIATFTALLLYLVAFSGEEHGRALWFFSLPVLAGMMLPPRHGAIWAGASIAVAAAIMLLGGPEFGTSAYSLSFTLRFVITATLISVGMFWSEISLRRYQDASAAQKAATQAESSRLKAEIARRAQTPRPLHFSRTRRAPSAATTPTDTIVTANPRLKLATITTPRVTSFNCRQISSTVMAAGQGISPPVSPNSTICQVVTGRSPKRCAISAACSRSCASM